MNRDRLAWRLTWMALLLLLASALPTWADSPGAASNPYPSLQMLADPDGSLSLEDVLAAAAAGRFLPVSNAFSGGYTRQVHWFRFTLKPPPHQPSIRGVRRLLLEVQPSYLDDIRLFSPKPGAPGQFDMRVTGDTHPFSSRELPGRNFVFYLYFPDAEPQTFYLRLQTHSSSFLLLRAWEPTTFLGIQTREYALLGLYYGLLLALLLFNLYYVEWRNEPAYLPFMANLGCLLLLMPGLNGLLSEYLLPDYPHIASHWVSWFVLISVGLTAHLYRTILDINQRQPWLNAYFITISGLPLIACLSIPLGYFVDVVAPLLYLYMLAPLLGLLRAWQLLRQQRVGSRFLILATLFSLAGYAYSLSALVGLTEGHQGPLYGIQLGALLSLLAFNAVLLGRQRQRHQQLALDQKAAEQAQSTHEATQLLQQRQGALLSMLTHELKTPLGVIRLALDRLSGDKTVLRHARTAVSDISAVVNRSMQADLLDKGAITLQMAPCDLASILQELKDQTQDPGRVELVLPPQLPPLLSDALLLRSILSNLLDNALKYSPSGSTVSLAVTLQNDAQGLPGLRVSVENQPGSVGHPDPNRLFERYYRSPTAYVRTGSGLGLFIAQQLAKRLGIELHYVPGLEYDPVRFTCQIPCPP